MSQKIPERLETLRKLNSNRQWVNDDLYRLMFKEDLYIIAYEQIKSKPGNMTPGTDGETLDGLSMKTIGGSHRSNENRVLSIQTRGLDPEKCGR